MLIRPAIPGDAFALATIHVQTWQEAYRGLMPDAVLDALCIETRTAFWRKLLSTAHRTVVAVSDASLIGFCSVIPARDGAAGVAELAALYVSPEHWRQGAGRALCAAACEAATGDGFSAMTLWVLTTNARALAFYEAQGFVRDGWERTDALSDGSLILEARLHRRLP